MTNRWRKLAGSTIPFLALLLVSIFQAAPLAAAPRPVPQAVVSSASFLPTVAPNSLASLFGSELGPQTLVGSLDADGNLPLNLGGVSVSVDGRPAQLLFVSPSQINFLIPGGASLGRVALVVTREESGEAVSTQTFIQVEAIAPAIFHAGVIHPDRASAIDAVTFQSGPIVTGGSDATYVSLYGTGIRGAGAASVQLIDRTGHVTDVEALYAGPAPGFLGLDQVNFIVPNALGSAGVLELRLRLGGRFSNVVSIDLTAVPGPSYNPGEYLVRAFAGTGLPGHDGDGAAATLALLQGPHDVELAADGSLLIADAGNRVIRRVSLQGQITTFAGNGEEGSGGDGGLAVNASFRLPISIAADTLGNVYVADAGDHRVRRIDVNGVITTLAGVGVEGFGGDGGPANAALLSAPSGIAVNGLGSVLIADTGNNRVRLVTADGMIQTIAGSGDAGDSGDGGPAVGAQLSAPTSLEVSELNTVFFSDSGNRKVRRIDANGLIHTVVSLDDVTESTALSSVSVALDANEQLVLSDADLHHLAVFGLDSLMHLVAGQEWPGSLGDGGLAIEAELHAPGGTVTNPFGDIFLADVLNNKVRLLWRKLGDPDAECGQVAGVAFLPSIVLGGEKTLGFVRLNCPTDVDVTVLLNSDTPEVPAPPSVTLSAGVLFDIFVIDTPVVEEPIEVTVTGTGGGGIVGGTIMILPGDGPGIRGLTLTADTVIGGQTTVGQIHLGAPAPAGGLLVELSSDQLDATVVATVMVPEGAIAAEFLIDTNIVTEPVRVMINGATEGISASASLLILPVNQGDSHQLVSLVVDASVVLGGVSATATVTADKPAPAGGLEVVISSSTPMLTAPLTVTIPAGQTSVSFQIQTGQVSARLLATLLATCGNTVRATLTIDIELGPGQADLLSLTLAPTTVTGGQGSTGTVQLAAPAPAGGVLVLLSSNNAAATVPGSILIAKGQTSGQFSVATTPPGSQQTATITATSANSVNAALTIDPVGPVQANIGSITVSPNPVTGGQNVDGTVILVGPAPAGGVQVALGSNNANAAPPASILIPAGQTTGQFVLTTLPVGAQETAQITATSANTVNVTLTINATPAGQGQINGLTLAPSSVVGGQSSTGTVTLAAAAPPQGVLVNLSSGDPNASTPAAVVVLGGQTSAQFTVTTVAVGSQTAAQITATSANSVNATLTIQVPPAGQGQISGLTLVPSTVNGGQPSTGAVTLTAAAPVGGILVNLASGDANAATPASIMIPAGQTSGQFTITTSAVGAQVLAQITATSANAVNATLTINATPAGQGQISGLTLAPTAVNGGQTSTGTVTLGAAAPIGGVLVNLSSGDPNATTPASIVIPAGQTTGQFTVTTVAVASQVQAQITAASANSLSATLTINPPTAGQGQITGLTLAPNPVTGGQSSTGTVTLFSAAPAGGVLVNLASGNPNATTPASIVIPEGQTTGQFTVTTVVVSSQVQAQINATSANSFSATLTINPPTAGQGQISGLTLAPSTVNGGQSSTGTVTLGAAAPAGGILVNLSSGNANATTPASIVIPAGQTSGQFTVTTVAVASQTLAQITATSANSVNATLTINATPAGQGQISGLSLSPNAVNGGASSTGTVTLATAAPIGGVLVNLSSGNVKASTPASIVIPAGQTSGQFTVTTVAVASQVLAQITATSANSVNATLTINATPAGQGQISGLSLSPSAVNGGASSTGTVTLATAAPIGGVLVNLSSGNVNATTPASIVIPSGQTAGQFTVNTSAVGAQQTAQITATSANSANATLTINATPAGLGQLSGLSLSPSTVKGGVSSTGTVTLASAAPIGGILVNLSSGNANATTPASIVIPAGQTSGQFTISTVVVGAPQSAVITATSSNSVNATLTINPPLYCVNSLVLNVTITDLLSGDGILKATVTLDGPAPQGGTEVQLVRSGANIGTVLVPEGQTTASVNLAVTNLLTLVGSTVQAVLNGCPAVQATIALGSPITGSIAGVSLNPSTVFAGQAVTGTVTLAAPAGSNGVLVSLSTNNPSATILASSVVVPAGQISTTFPVNTVNSSASPVVVSITATSGASSKSANLTINSSNPCVEGLQLTVNITNLVSGTGVLNALVTLTGPAPAGGANVPLLIGATQIGQVAIPANQSTGLAEIALANLPTLVGSVVQAVFGPCGGVNATIALNAPILGSLVVPASLTLGNGATGTVILDSPAPAGGATIQLTKTPLGLVGNLLNALLGAVVMPSSVTVPAGQTQANFSITSSVIGGALGLLFPSSADLQIDATLNSAFTGNTLTQILTCNK